jgi:signal transduction histidine kinase
MQEALGYLDQLAATYVDVAVTGPEGKSWSERPESIPEEMNVQVLLETLSRMFSGDATQVGAAIRIVSSSLVALVRPLALIRILANLVANALQHGQCRRVVLGCRRRGSAWISIEVHDDGNGMSAEELARVQARGAKGIGSNGNGLGLAILRDLVDCEGFQLEMTSSPKRGTRVRVLVPSAQRV